MVRALRRHGRAAVSEDELKECAPPPHGGGAEDVAIIPCDGNATINPRPLPAALSVFKLTYPVLYPLRAVRAGR